LIKSCFIRTKTVHLYRIIIRWLCQKRHLVHTLNIQISTFWRYKKTLQNKHLIFFQLEKLSSYNNISNESLFIDISHRIILSLIIYLSKLFSTREMSIIGVLLTTLLCDNIDRTGTCPSRDIWVGPPSDNSRYLAWWSAISREFRWINTAWTQCNTIWRGVLSIPLSRVVYISLPLGSFYTVCTLWEVHEGTISFRGLIDYRFTET